MCFPFLQGVFEFLGRHKGDPDSLSVALAEAWAAEAAERGGMEWEPAEFGEGVVAEAAAAVNRESGGREGRERGGVEGEEGVQLENLVTERKIVVDREGRIVKKT